MPEYNYDIKRIGSTDFSLLIPLMKNCFGMDADIEYFSWKYTENPAGSFVGFVAIEESTGEIGGYYGVIPQVFELEGKMRTIYQSCDTMTHSDHRRRGLFRKLATYCYRELEKEAKLFVIGFGGGQSTPGFLKFGWKAIFDFRYYFKPSALCQLARFSQLDRSDILVTEALKAIENGLDISRKNIHSKAKSVRSSEQIKWRLSNPYHLYMVAQLKSDSKSYLIYYEQAGKLVLFDFSFENSQSGKTLMTYLFKEILKNGYRGIFSFSQENGMDANTLKEYGFINNPFNKGPLSERVPFIFYSTEEEMKQYLSPLDWQITSYDHDSL